VHSLPIRVVGFYWGTCLDDLTSRGFEDEPGDDFFGTVTSMTELLDWDVEDVTSQGRQAITSGSVRIRIMLGTECARNLRKTLP